MGILAHSLDRRNPARFYVAKRVFFAHGTSSSTDNYMEDLLDPNKETGSIKYVLVDILQVQNAAGTGGTSWALTVKKNNSGVCNTTNGVITLASGANQKVDAASQLSLPSGATRPVLTSTVANRIFQKGDRISFDVTLTGVYTAGPTISVYCVFEVLGALARLR